MRNTLLQAVLTTVLFIGPPLARGSLIANGGFESQPNFGSGVSGDPGYSALTGSQVPGWTIEAGHAATVHNTVLYPTISGNYSINTDGEGYNGHNANLYQDFATVGGASYQLTFDWMTWVEGTSPSLSVTVTDTVSSSVLYNGLFAPGASLVVHHEATSFVGTGNPLRLRIQESPESGFNDNRGIVDNFSVVQTEAVAVPEPSSLLMCGTAGLLSLGALARRSRRRIAA